MEYIFLTNSAPQNSTLGNQRTNFLIDFFSEIFARFIYFSIVRLNFQEFIDKNVIGKRNLPFFADIEFALAINMLIQNQDFKVLKLVKKLSRAQVVIADNCYVWPLVREAKRLNPALRIIYSSHNIEVQLKEKIAAQENSPVLQTTEYLEFLAQIEKEVLNTADLVFACSDDDSKLQLLSGARECIVIPNGGKLRKIPTPAKEDIHNYLGAEKYALFVASAHRPNIHGFLHGIGLDFGFMPDKTRLVLVGSSAKYIYDRINNSKYQKTFLNKGSRIDYASDKLLAQLYSSASVVILPIYEGGGTNIKTAEAFLNSQSILTTSYALRGYDQRLWTGKSFHIIETRSQFKKGIIANLETTSSKPVTDEVNAFSWEWIRIEYFDIVQKVFQKHGF